MSVDIILMIYCEVPFCDQTTLTPASTEDTTHRSGRADFALGFIKALKFQVVVWRPALSGPVGPAAQNPVMAENLFGPEKLSRAATPHAPWKH